MWVDEVEDVLARFGESIDTLNEPEPSFGSLAHSISLNACGDASDRARPVTSPEDDAVANGLSAPKQQPLQSQPSPVSASQVKELLRAPQVSSRPQARAHGSSSWPVAMGTYRRASIQD